MSDVQKFLIALAIFAFYRLDSSAASEVDPEWMYWVLGIIATVCTAGVELLRSRPVKHEELSALSERIGKLETSEHDAGEYGERIARLETHASFGERLARVEGVTEMLADRSGESEVSE